MSHLLLVTRLDARLHRKTPKNTPLFVEFKVTPETAPYLVSSSSSVMWIPETLPGDIIRAAVRECALGDFFSEVVDAVIAMGQQHQWGNTHPLTIEGLQAAVQYVEYYDMGPLELLIPRSHRKDIGPSEDEDEGASEEISDNLMSADLRPILESVGLPFRPSSWVPEGVVVVVPRDRAFVGVVNKLHPRKIVGVVHNAARGIAIARRQNELVEQSFILSDAE